MFKKILLAMYLAVSLSATQIDVKKGDVQLSINGKLKNYKVGSYNEQNVLQVCFDNGNGVVKIDNDIVLNIDTFENCKQISQKQNVVATITDNLYKLLINTGNDYKVGATKSVSIQGTSKIKEVFIPKSEKVFVINADIAPVPITLTILDNQNNTVKHMINDTDNVSIFFINRDELQTGYRLQLTDFFKSVRFDAKVVLEK